MRDHRIKAASEFQLTMGLTPPKADREPWVAGVLSVLLPGLGHLYLGRPGLGVCWFVTIQALVFASALIALTPFLSVFNFLIRLAGYLFLIISAVRLARSVRRTYKLQVWNRWYVYLGVFVVGVSTSFFLSEARKEFVVQAYNIPSGAMNPTLLIGDHILVSKLSYGLQWPQDCKIRASFPPITCYSSSTLVSLGTPQRGDVIVFRYPEDEDKDFIKRIVGLPGDVIEIHNKVVHVNGVPLDDRTYTQRIDPGIIDGSVNPRDNFGPVTVPEGSYFVMGDNRDQSLDSRFWGYVRANKIKGRAFRIYWSWSGQGKWSEWVRWERIDRRI